jgi:SAM-dependent methyltransferase
VPAPCDAFDDAWFDDQLPVGLQLKAEVHFTPLEVVRQAVALLVPFANMSVLDVGSGSGKFCIEAARVAPSARFVGVEWRPHLVQLATRLARDAGRSNVGFIHGNAFDHDWSTYDAFYFYNPFAEQHIDRSFVIDETIAFDPSNFDLYVTAAFERLARARPGTRVVTYHGLGGPLPESYELASAAPTGSDRVELWIKQSA